MMSSPISSPWPRRFRFGANDSARTPAGIRSAVPVGWRLPAPGRRKLCCAITAPPVSKKPRPDTARCARCTSSTIPCRARGWVAHRPPCRSTGMDLRRSKLIWVVTCSSIRCSPGMAPSPVPVATIPISALATVCHGQSVLAARKSRGLPHSLWNVAFLNKLLLGCPCRHTGGTDAWPIVRTQRNG